MGLYRKIFSLKKQLMCGLDAAKHDNHGCYLASCVVVMLL